MPSGAEVGTDKFSFYMRRKHEQELRQAGHYTPVASNKM